MSPLSGAAGLGLVGGQAGPGWSAGLTAAPVTGFEGVVGSSANWKSRNWRIFSVAAQQNFEIETCKQIAAAAAAVMNES